MKSSALLILLPSHAATQFVPLSGLFATPKHQPAPAVQYRTSSHSAQTSGVEFGSDPLLEHAKDCVDHFGECTVEDLEKTRLSLHAERLKNLLTGSSDASWPQAELDSRALEHDLTLQLELLKEHIGADEMTMADMEVADARVHHLSSDQMVNDLDAVDAILQHPQDDDAPISSSELHMRGDTGSALKQGRVAVRPTADSVPVPVPLSDAVAPDNHAHWSPWMEDFAMQGWKAFDASATEAVAIAATVLIIMLLPQALEHAQL